MNIIEDYYALLNRWSDMHRLISLAKEIKYAQKPPISRAVFRIN